MNKLESDYAAHLALLQAAGEVAAFDFEPMKLRLADRTWYEIDFLVQRPDATLEVHEVKGHWEDDARVKIKVAAETHSWLRFFVVQRKLTGWRTEAVFIEDRAAEDRTLRRSRRPRLAALEGLDRAPRG